LGGKGRPNGKVNTKAYEELLFLREPSINLDSPLFLHQKPTKRTKSSAADSVSNTGNTETGFPVFWTLNTDTDNILAVLPVLRTSKVGVFLV
jgi:hypothetical protein